VAPGAAIVSQLFKPAPLAARGMCDMLGLFGIKTPTALESERAAPQAGRSGGEKAAAIDVSVVTRTAAANKLRTGPRIDQNFGSMTKPHQINRALKKISIFKFKITTVTLVGPSESA